MNPAGFFRKYDLPSHLPDSVGTDGSFILEKGYYRGVIFDIPGAEVLVDGQWIAFDARNKDRILAMNPMDLEWRLDGDLLRKMGYTAGQTVEGRVLAVDDQWNGLRLEKEISVLLQ